MSENTVITWRTKKVANGFEFRVFTVGYKEESEVLKTGILPTRARAKSFAQKWCKYLKAQKKAA